jgi:hypothetical protein
VLEIFFEKLYSKNIDQKKLLIISKNILINEIIPRAKKCKLNINMFISPFEAGILTRCELLNYITRHETRQILDKIFASL